MALQLDVQIVTAGRSSAKGNLQSLFTFQLMQNEQGMPSSWATCTSNPDHAVPVTNRRYTMSGWLTEGTLKVMSNPLAPVSTRKFYSWGGAAV